MPCISYFDDFSGVAPSNVASFCLSIFTEFSGSLGFPVKGAKNECGEKIQYLGLDVEVADRVIISALLDKREKHRELISRILNSGMCSRSDADSLYGKLQWCSVSVFGRGAKVRLAPILRQKFSSAQTLPCDLVWALEFCRVFLSAPCIRGFVRPSQSVDFVAFSDASLGDLGVCIVGRDGSRSFFASSVPDDFHRRPPAGVNPIFILE